MTRLTRSSLTRGPRLYSAVIVITLFIQALGTQALASDQAYQTACDCSCERYLQLLEQSLPRSPLPEDQRWACAGACAIAWVRCEERQIIVDSESDESDGRLNNALSIQASTHPQRN
jgi:hypothetical protein